MEPSAAITMPIHVLELRQYTLHAGQRDTLIELFEGEFIEPQEAAGAHIVGQFRDLERAERMVWLRGFQDMAVRAQALQTFYGGPVWSAHRAAAAATMIDYDDVLLLCPAEGQPELVLPQTRAERGAPASAGGVVVATIYLLRAPVEADFLSFFAQNVRPTVTANGAEPLACFKTLYADNDFRMLPVREGVHAFVWLTTFASVEDERRYRERLSDSPQWREQIAPRLAQYCSAPVQALLLEPAARSLLRHRPADAGRGVRRGKVHTGSREDFDFLSGNWQVRNRQLQQRDVGCETWDEFPATMSARLHLGGLVNTDEILFPTLGWSGMTLRTFDLERRQWSIYWINSREGRLLPPVVGGFEGDHGEFYGKDHDGDRPVEVRFLWTRAGANAARWEQAFCYDGQTWETNWIMEFTRARG